MTVLRAIILITLIGFIIFFNSFFNGFLWDDEEQVLNNSAAHSMANLPYFFQGSTFNTGGGGLGGLYYKPLMTTFFALFYTFFGPTPFFFHFFQVLLHIINAILVFLLLKKFLRENQRSLLISLFLALVFLVHPINVESAIYISALQDTLYMFFGLLALLLFTAKGISFKRWFGIFFLLLCSLLSKETGIVFLGAFLLYTILFKRDQLKRGLVLLFILGLTYTFLRFGIAHIFFDRHGLSPLTRLSLLERIPSLPAIMWSYLQTFIWPSQLGISQHWVVASFDLYNFWIPLILNLITLLLMALGGFLVYRKNFSLFKVYLFFGLLYLGALLLHLQLFPLDMTVADRWFYAQGLGILGMGAVLLAQISGQRQHFRLVVVIAIILISGLSIRTLVRNSNWKDGLTLFSHDIKYVQGSFDLENNLGVELFRVERTPEAKTHFVNSTKIAPFWWTNWNNLGAVEEREGRFSEAKLYYQKAIDNGHYYLAYENLAKIYLTHDQDYQKAYDFSTESLKTLPSNGNLWLIKALSSYKLEKSEEALVAAQNAYLLNPNAQTLELLNRLKLNKPVEF
jgi:protein O-mannosyl-transferase